MFIGAVQFALARENLILLSEVNRRQTEAMADGKYGPQSKWAKQNSVMYAIRVYKTSEQDMIDFLEKHRPSNRFIKELIREAMEKNKS